MLWRFDLLHRIPDRKGKLTIRAERRRKLPKRGFRAFFIARRDGRFRGKRASGTGARGATLPCPVGARGAAGVRVRRCLPRWGKGASELARLILAGLRGKVRCGRSAFQEGLAGAPGGTGGTQSARDGNTRITDENAPFPDRTFHFIRLRRRPSCSPSRDRHIPPPSRGENGGLCPHPPKGPVPWVSLFGDRLSSSRYPRPPKRRRRQAPARGLAAVNSHRRPIRNETQNARPLLVGRAFVYFEPTALAGRTAARRSSMRAGSSVSSISKPVS